MIRMKDVVSASIAVAELSAGPRSAEDQLSQQTVQAHVNIERNSEEGPPLVFDFGMSATTYPACSVPWFRINDIPEASLVVQARANHLLN